MISPQISIWMYILSICPTRQCFHMTSSQFDVNTIWRQLLRCMNLVWMWRNLTAWLLTSLPITMKPELTLCICFVKSDNHQCVTSLGHQTRWLCQVIPNQSAPFHSEGQCQDFLSLRWFAKIAAKIFHTNVVFALANQHTEWKFEIVAKNLTLGAFFNLIVQLKLNRSNENKRSHPTGKPICNLYDTWI